MKKQKVISILLVTFLSFSFLFLSIQFKSSSQSHHVSTAKLADKPVTQNKKILFILIDAAKYSYVSQMPFIAKLQQENPENSLLFKCKAGMPTMTTQRIQSLMTGSEIFSTANIIDSFFSSKVHVDNIISQLALHNKSSFTLGDDTWGKLFPFNGQIPCKSTFDIWDWNTCDDMIYQNLFTSISSNYSLTVAHFLALDHIGHSTSSLTDQAMKTKKQTISNFIEETINKLPENYIVMVTGDHGMREDGNHGGSTDDETETFFFLHQKNSQYTLMHEKKTILQPDITATLSLLLNIPNPMNSIGIPVVSLGEKQKIIDKLRTHFEEVKDFSHLQCAQKLESSLDSLWKYRQDCLHLLTHTNPNILHISIVIVIMGCLLLLISFILRISLIEYLCVIAISFPCYFSWLLIRNSSTYFGICLLVLILVSGQLKETKLQMGMLYFVLAQLQLPTVGEYSTSIFKISPLESIYQHQTIIMIFNALIFLGLLSQYSFMMKIEYILYFSLIITSNFLQNHSIVHYIHIVVLLIGMVFLCVKRNQRLLETRIILLGIISIFMDERAIYILLLSWLFLNIINDSTFFPYFSYLWSHVIWFTLGNRYEYSSIDIKRSYIFYDGYHQILNPLCLCIYMLLPYFIPIMFAHTSRKSEFVEVREEGEVEKQKKWIRWVLMSVCSLLSIYGNLVYNNEKILFTVVYVPMTVIETGKSLAFLLFVIIYNII